VNGCIGSAQTIVTLSPGFTVNVTTTDEHCGRADGTATATPVGGTGPFSYVWTGGLLTPTITGLTAASYSVTVTDANGCTGTGTGSLVNIAGPSAPFGPIVNETCGYCNGSITIAPVNGTPPYTYIWSVAGAGATISNLCAGNYAVTVTDANTCTANNNTSITNSPAPVLSQGTVTSANCGFNDGGAQPNVAGGTAPVTFSWSNGQATLNLSNVIGGNYTLIATDANGCKDTLVVTVPTLGGPSASTTGTDALCGNADGTACVTAVGGSGAYTYIWNNGLNTNCISNLSPGLYTVTVDDGNCFVISSYSVGDIPGPNADFSVTPLTATIDNPLFNFYDQSTGAITYAWYFGDGGTSNTQNPSYSYSQSGTFIITLIVTNNAGCVDSIKQEVIIKDNFVIWVPNAFSPNGDGMNETFGPKGVGLDPDHFEFYVFDRWGEELFRSTNVNLQWDGTFKGGKPKQDVYTLLIIIKGVDGLPYKYNGHVTLIK
jgi:gliding motility-associated-like protein